MNMSLAGFQQDFGRALFDDGDSPLALTSQPGFSVYRNTVMKGCVDALEANYPSVARLVGPDWFHAAAALYVRAEPPRDARLQRYGEGFAAFLRGFTPAADLPYLGFVAQLDRGWTESHVAADARPADAGWLAGLAPESLGATVLRPHPAARWAWFDDMPVYSIWQRNRSDDAAQHDGLPWQGEGALLTRPDAAVCWGPLGRGGCAFLNTCAAGRPLGDAAEAALAAEAGIDLTATLSHLLQRGALIA
jgi:Putative DNA-binding domain